MDTEKLKRQINYLLGVLKIPDEEKENLKARLPISTPEQLAMLQDNLMRQAATEIYVDFLDELDSDDKLLDEEDEKEYESKLEAKLAALDSSVFSETEIDSLREKLGELKSEAVGNNSQSNPTV